MKPETPTTDDAAFGLALIEFSREFHPLVASTLGFSLAIVSAGRIDLLEKLAEFAKELSEEAIKDLGKDDFPELIGTDT